MRVWAGLAAVSTGLKCVSCGQAHNLVRAWRGFGAGLGGFGWCERRIEVRFVWPGTHLVRARRGFGAGLVGVSEGLKCVSCGPGACLVRAWRGLGVGLVGVV